MKKKVTGKRAEIPEEVGSDVRNLIERCWSGDSDDRPNFGDIFITLEKFGFRLCQGANEQPLDARVRAILEAEKAQNLSG